MTSNQRSIDRFESIARRVVEGALGRLLRGRIDVEVVAAEVAAALETRRLNGMAPNRFTVELHPRDFQYVTTNWPDAQGRLVSMLGDLCQEFQLQTNAPITVQLSASRAVPLHSVSVSATHSVPESAESTQPFVPLKPDDPLVEIRARDAFLVVNGRQHIVLDKVEFSIGRQSDSDLALTDRRVSRRHAVIRWRFGRFVLHDLNSRAGTIVNGQRVSQYALRPGDVISLPDVLLIYGESAEAPNGVDGEEYGTNVTRSINRPDDIPGE